ncbi:MAG: RNA polymerase sigma factor [Acidobacteriota bacterium]
MEQSDPQLVDRLRAGDRAALEPLYRRYVDRVWRYAWLRTRCREKAADIVQETFLRIVRSIEGFEGRSALSTWVFAVTRSVTIDQLRRSGRDRPDADSPTILKLIPAAENAGDETREGLREAVRQAVSELPPAQRDVVMLCSLSGMKMKEAAEVLGWSESRVKVTLFRARRALRERLMDDLRNADARSARTRS